MPEPTDLKCHYDKPVTAVEFQIFISRSEGYPHVCHSESSEAPSTTARRGLTLTKREELEVKLDLPIQSHKRRTEANDIGGASQSGSVKCPRRMAAKWSEC
ncbi:hypothetical protein EDC04DRAFT_2616373 [Pisolithus marmoratus]|nr:hypothetical protein EDC04DRAFT_2616373 [Pisolithus marmoratus]